MAWASTVAVVVPSPAISDVLLATSRAICAPMFSSGSFSSISLATVTPSFVIVGEPNFLSRTTLRPLGPRVTLTASAQLIDAAQDGLARLVTIHNLLCHDVSSPVLLRLPTRLLLLFLGLAFDGGQLLLGLAFDDGQHVILFHDEVLLAIQLDLLARILAEQDPVARFDVERDPLAVVCHLPVDGGDDRALLRLLFGGVRDDDPADVLFAFVEALNKDAVV